MMTNSIKKILILIIIAIASNYGQQIKKNKYGLFVVDNISTYRDMAAKDSSNELVNLQKIIPNVKLDIRYATKNNFLGEPVYNSAYAFLRLPAALSLKKVQEELKILGLGIKVFDAYRPYSATVKFYNKVKDTVYVASAWTGSRHNRGCAIDLTLISLKTGKSLEMPTGFDSFLEKAHSDYLKLPPDEIRNRDLLIGVMAKYGFNNYPGEWWHYDFKDWNKYDLMDISFEQLNNQ
jgi:D-alanyl-D-alanine dipeptidase